MKMICYPHANKTHFHNKGFALSLVLKARVFGTQKWPQAPIEAIALNARSGLPVLPHFPTRSLKQDNETCVGVKV